MKLNHKIATALAAVGIGYAIGNINPAYIVGLRKGYDIRKRGSGNPGATNLMLLEGKKAGAFVTALREIFSRAANPPASLPARAA